MTQYEQLVEFYKEKGDLKIPYYNNIRLNRFLNRVRNQLSKFVGLDNQPIVSANEIQREKIRLLNKLGVSWPTMKKPKWDQRYLELLLFLKGHEYTDLDRNSKDKSIAALARWVTDQRSILNKYIIVCYNKK